LVQGKTFTDLAKITCRLEAELEPPDVEGVTPCHVTRTGVAPAELST
jgi:hypothetical protein